MMLGPFVPLAAHEVFQVARSTARVTVHGVPEYVPFL